MTREEMEAKRAEFRVGAIWRGGCGSTLGTVEGWQRQLLGGVCFPGAGHSGAP